jgi:hypothetical protein
MESLSGMDLSDVRVHANSSMPAQLNALAYAQGSDVYLGPGQGAHLPHEIWHVVQQRQGRVRPTRQFARVDINDDRALESEADAMGQAALSHGPAHLAPRAVGSSGGSARHTVQRKMGFEFETSIPVRTGEPPDNAHMGYQERVFTANTALWKIVADGSNMEFVTEPFDENLAGRVLLGTTMTEVANWAAAIPPVVTGAAAAGHPATGRVSAVNAALGTTADTGLLDDPIVIDMAALADADITCAPQATGGVRLEQIPALVHAMTATQIVAAQPQAEGLRLQTVHDTTLAALDAAVAANVITVAKRAAWIALRNKLVNYQAASGVTPQQHGSSLVGMNVDDAMSLVTARQYALAAVDAHVATLPLPAPNFEKLKGLLTLVISYLLVGQNTAQVMPYSKIIAPLMARTNFYAMFQQLAAWEQAWFRTANVVLAAAHMAGTGGTAVFPHGFHHRGNVEHGPSRAAWLDSIARGSPGTLFGSLWRNKTDLLSQGSGSRAAANSTSLGAMPELDTRVTGERDLAVLELRRLPKKVHRAEWRQMALGIFDAIQALP